MIDCLSLFILIKSASFPISNRSHTKAHIFRIFLQVSFEENRNQDLIRNLTFCNSHRFVVFVWETRKR